MKIKIRFTDYKRIVIKHIRELHYIWIQLGSLLITLKYNHIMKSNDDLFEILGWALNPNPDEDEYDDEVNY